MSTFKLSVEEGIKIQTEQLAEWKQLLLPHVYEYLEKRAVKDNHLAKDGFSIRRGSDLSCDVSNYLYYKKNVKL